MKEFANGILILAKDVKKGEKESLLSLFSAAERFKPMEVLVDADEECIIRVVLEGIGQIDLKLGADVKKGEKKTIMTLFWFAERSKPIEIMKDVKAGQKVEVRMWLVEAAE